MPGFFASFPSSGSGSSGVTSLNSMVGALTLVAGTNITITPGSGTLTIDATIPSSGANASLSNLTNPTAINQDLLPDSDGARSLGSSSLGFNVLWVDNAVVSTGNLAIQAQGGSINLAPSAGNFVRITDGSGLRGASATSLRIDTLANDIDIFPATLRVNFGANFVPNGDNSYDLGAPANRMANVYNVNNIGSTLTLGTVGTVLAGQANIYGASNSNIVAIVGPGVEGGLVMGSHPTDFFMQSITADGSGLLALRINTSGGDINLGAPGNLLTLDGDIKTNGTPVVASFGPAPVVSITVKNGLIVAIS